MVGVIMEQLGDEILWFQERLEGTRTRSKTGMIRDCFWNGCVMARAGHKIASTPDKLNFSTLTSIIVVVVTPSLEPPSKGIP